MQARPRLRPIPSKLLDCTIELGKQTFLDQLDYSCVHVKCNFMLPGFLKLNKFNTPFRLILKSSTYVQDK